jgi:hypothetical protein
MPASRCLVALFIVFGGGAMGARRKFVLLGSFPVSVVHDVSPSTSYLHETVQFRALAKGPLYSRDASISAISSPMARDAVAPGLGAFTT